jgi:hypothetical protein
LQEFGVCCDFSGFFEGKVILGFPLFVVSAETVKILLIELEFCCALRSNWFFFDGIVSFLELLSKLETLHF